MRKLCIILLLLFIITLTGVGCVYTNNQANEQYLRIHIRADSNDDNAQRIKYEVSKKVVDYLTPLVSECKTKEEAVLMLEGNLLKIEEVCNSVLKSGGYNYTASARIDNECFPTRVYDSLTLERGFYDALIIDLGSGEGNNWWCVVYPPLCFVESNAGYVYKSKIISIINEFLLKRGEKQ